MNRTIAALLAASLFVTACGDEASIENCDDVVDASVALMQDLLVAVEAQTPGSLSDLGDLVDVPELAPLAARSRIIASRSQELACTEVDQLVALRVEELRPNVDNAITRAIVDAVRNGVNLFAQLFD